MKEKDAFVECGDHPVLMFVEKEDGTYGPLQTSSYMAKNYINDFFDKMCNLEKACFEKLTSGRFSPIAYYMMLKDMTAADVAVRARLSVRTVKKHMRPHHFGSMTLEVARRYAEVFGVAVADLFQIPERPAKGLEIHHQTTSNPFVVLTRCTGDTQ